MRGRKGGGRKGGGEERWGEEGWGEEGGGRRVLRNLFFSLIHPLF